MLAAHQNDPNSLFVTTAKKRPRVDDLTAQHVSLPQHAPSATKAGADFVSPALDVKIRANEAIAGHPAAPRGAGGQHPDRHIADKILTPSFISSDMQASNQRRRSDLLLRKKEPSLPEANGRLSLGGAVVEDFMSSALDHSMCSNGNCLRESRFSLPKQAAAAIQ